MTEVLQPNGAAHLNGNGNADYEMGIPAPNVGPRFTSGLILPPPEIKGM